VAGIAWVGCMGLAAVASAGAVGTGALHTGRASGWPGDDGSAGRFGSVMVER
jgi:hypothetical protein